MRMIFLAARYPVPGMSMSEQYEDESEAAGSQGETREHFAQTEDGYVSLTPESARYLFYHDCPPGIADWAAARISPQSSVIVTEKTPLTKWPSVPSTVIAGTADRCIPIDWQRAAARRKFGVQTVELNSGHSPFLVYPGLLAELIDHEISMNGTSSA
jgi:pimeloyl-ACP methyl ester carboxylesterase